jgi:predicted DsbA family dithiol-disulfide isomerase
MSKPIRIDFVSDVVCPWCAIGLGGLEQAIERLGDEIEVELHFQPFELNPQMGPEGENIVEHIGKKYGSTPDQSAASRKMIRDRAAEVGFIMAMDEHSRIYNTFDAHRLLHWAGTIGPERQQALKHALLEAYFTHQQNPSDAEVLVDAAVTAGLDGEEARAVLNEGRYADDVRMAEEGWRRSGVNAVPSVIVNRRYLIQGGQPADAFEEALRGIAAGD